MSNPEYTWPTVADFERDLGYPVNEAFEVGWRMGRTTNKMIGLSAAISDEPLTDSYVQVVPDKCDQIVWRNHYYHLPIKPSQPAQTEPVAWRSAVLDLIDDCPGLTMEQDTWLSRRVKEMDFASAPKPAQPVAKTDLEKDAASLLFLLHDAWPFIHQSSRDTLQKRVLHMMRKHGDFADLHGPNPVGDIEFAALELLRNADKVGLVVTIEQRPLMPLAMGNHQSVVLVRQKRERAA